MDCTLMVEGGGFHAFWHNIGQGRELLAADGGLSNPTECRIEGWSAGSMVACLLVFPEVPVERLISAALETKEETRISFGCLDEVVKVYMGKVLPMDAHVRASGKLGIVLCESLGNRCGKIVRQWNTRDELIACLVASSFVPGIVAFHFKDPVYGCVDGGFSRNLEELKKGKVFVCSPTVPFCSQFQAITKEHAETLVEQGEQKARSLMPTLRQTFEPLHGASSETDELKTDIASIPVEADP